MRLSLSKARRSRSASITPSPGTIACKAATISDRRASAAASGQTFGSLRAAHNRNDPWDEELLGSHQQTEQDSQDNAVNEGPREHGAFVTLEVRHRAARGDVLRRDDLTHHTARRIRRSEEDGIEVELARGDDLKIAEERVAGCVAAGQQHRNPPQERRQQDEQMSG